MAIDPSQFRAVMGGFATGVTVVTTHDGAGRHFGLTANALCSVSLVPPLLLICVDKSAESYSAFGRSGAFVVNILARAQEDLSRRFATSGGDKFTDLAFEVGQTGAAILPGTLGALECRIVGSHDAGDHTIHVGEVLECTTGAGAPLLFFRGKYRDLD